MDEELSFNNINYKFVSSKMKKIRRTLLTLFILLPALIVVIITYFFIQIIWILLILLPVAIIYIWGLYIIGRQIDNYKYAQTEKDFIISKGVLFKSVIVIPYGRLQFIDVEQGPFLRKYNLARITFHTASYQSLSPLIGVEEKEAKALRKSLLELGEANLAGL